MEKPFATVIIPTFNRASFLKEAIDSVLSQTVQDFELIVVDDGSTDTTREVLSLYRGKLSAIASEQEGPSAARNKGIAAARGEFIAFLDSDDLWLPKKLETQVRFFRNNPEKQVCQTEEIWIRNGVRVNPMKKHKKVSGWIFEQCLPLCIVSPSAVMIHKSVFESIGLFDESMQACEDYDLWLRIAPQYEMCLLPEPLVIKRGGHADQQSRTVSHLDRLRIQALCKAVESNSLTPSQRHAAYAEMQKKCFIYGNGCLKRGKEEEARVFLALPEKYKKQ